MKQILRSLASLRFVVALLGLIIVCLSAGTILDSLYGADQAMRSVYGAAWFKVLLGLYGLSLLASLIELWPWGRERAGFVLTHGSMLLILCGALVTDVAKVEGQLVIEEGSAERILSPRPDPWGRTAPAVTLPFSIRLDAFEIDYYEGTHRPAMFRSRVTVLDPSAGKPRGAIIEMNRELSHGGYRFFQSSYVEGPEKDTTVLSVSRDPGQPIVFAGYGALVVGMITVLATRILQRRRRDREEEALRSAGLPPGSVGALVLALGLLSAAGPAFATSVPTDGDANVLRRLPTQHDGRVMPLDTLARETVFNLVGQGRVYGLDPTVFVLGLTFDPAGWSEEPILPVDRDLAVALGLPAETRRVSFRSVAVNPRFRTLTLEGHEHADAERPVPPLAQKAMKLEQRLLWMQGFFDQSVLRVVPVSDPGAAWETLPTLRQPADLIAHERSVALPSRVSRDRLDREVSLNRTRPSRVAWLVLAFSALLALAPSRFGRRILDVASFVLLVAGFATMSWGLAMRWHVGGRIPASNMYESLLFLAWGTGLFAVVATVLLRNRLVVQNAAILSTLTMALTDLLPIDPFIHPMPPVLSGTPWLAIHVPIIMVSYAVLGLGVVIAHMQVGLTLFSPGRKDLAQRMMDLLYWYTHVGSILLITGILTGSIWASSSWGRYWGWDPKEVWSLVAFLAYMAILHGRFERILGPFGVAAWSIAAFWTILMTYLGVNYVLATGLHSYGFGGGTVVLWMSVVAIAEIVFLTAAYLRHRGEPITAG